MNDSAGITEPSAPDRAAAAERFIVWGLVAAGIALRIWYLWDFSGSPLFTRALGADVTEYCARAREILAGRWFSSSPDIHAPLYPLFLALMLKLGGGSVPLVRALQLILNLGAWLALYRLLKYEGVRRTVRLTFLGLAMLLTVPVYYQAELVSEALLLPEAAACFWCLHFAFRGNLRRRRALGAAGAGVVMGALNLTHPMTLLFTVAEIVLAFCRRRRRVGALMLGAAVLIVGAWCAAQSIRYGRLCGIQANGGFNIYLGNNPAADGKCYIRPGLAWRRLHREAAAEAARRGISKDVVFLGRAAEFWLHHPGKGLALWGRKALSVLSPSESPSGSDLPPLLYFTTCVFFGRLLTPALFLLGAFGVWRIFRRRYSGFDHWLLLFFALYAAQIVTVTSGRYRLLMLAPVMLFAAVGGCEWGWRRWWFLIPAVVLGCGFLTITDYGKNRGEAAALYAEAVLHDGRWQFADELAAYAARTSSLPDPAQYANLRGAAAEGSGDLAAAEKHYRRATASEPELAAPWMNLANLAAQRGDSAAAEAHYRRAWTLDPQLPDLAYNYARFRFLSGAPCAAEIASALQAASGDAKVWNLAGMLAMRDKNYAHAAECFARAAEFAADPAAREAYRNNCRIAVESVRSAK